MSAKRNSFQVGIVTITVVLMFFAILLWISQGVSGDMRPISIRFKSSPEMPTLAAGSDVLVGGQKVGKVKKAALEKGTMIDARTGLKSEQFYVVVLADLRSDIALRSNCRAIAEGPPLGGDGVVKLDIGHGPDAWPDDRMIEGAEPAGFAAILASLQDEFNGDDPTSLLGQIKTQLSPDAKASLMAKLHQSFNDINTMTGALGKQFNADEKATLLAKFQEIADNVSAATGALRSEFATQKPEVLLGKIHFAMDAMNDGLGSLARVLKTNEPVINQTMANVETATGHIANETDPARPDSLMAHFKDAGELLNKSLSDIQTVTGTTRDVMVLNRENINRMLANFKEASDHVKTGMKYVLNHPWRLLNAPDPTEMKQQAIFDAARSFSEAATRIDDAAGQLKSLSDLHNGAIPSNNPDLARLETELKATQEKYRRAENELWRQLGVQ
ncbi:MAG: hypothetical protein AABZ08_11880 [Planctomycetota bacterium]